MRMYAWIFEPGNPYGESEWRRNRGALCDIGPHALSIILPALGPVTHMIADQGLGDTVMIVVHHEPGAASTMSLSLTAPPGSRESTLQIFGQDRQTPMPDARCPMPDARRHDHRGRGDGSMYLSLARGPAWAVATSLRRSLRARRREDHGGGRGVPEEAIGVSRSARRVTARGRLGCPPLAALASVGP